MVLRAQAEGNRTRIKRTREFEKRIADISGHVVTEQGFRGREESVCLEDTEVWRRWVGGHSRRWYKPHWGTAQ
jgi:hypothetical protein